MIDVERAALRGRPDGNIDDQKPQGDAGEGDHGTSIERAKQGERDRHEKQVRLDGPYLGRAHEGLTERRTQEQRRKP